MRIVKKMKYKQNRNDKKYIQNQIRENNNFGTDFIFVIFVIKWVFGNNFVNTVNKWNFPKIKYI